jgi:hypothetical protein
MTESIVRPVHPQSFGLAEHRYRHFDVIAPADTTAKELTNPGLWVHVANKIQPGDEIRVRAEDDSFVAYLYVTHRIAAQVRVKILQSHDLSVKKGEDVPKLDELPFVLKWRGPTHRFCIVEVATGSIIKENIADKVDGERDLADYLKVLGVAA